MCSSPKKESSHNAEEDKAKSEEKPGVKVALSAVECEDIADQVIMDSGCSRHMTGRKENFKNYKRFDYPVKGFCWWNFCSWSGDRVYDLSS